jgi:hypothetical protein
MSMNHFAYLLSEPSSRHTKVAADRLELLAKTAAKRYLEERVPLNSTIQKIAEENDLNANQIERICEMANIDTHRALWQKTAQKEAIAFPLADAKTVVKVVGKKPINSDDPDGPHASCPVMSDSDYAGPPKGIPMRGPSTMSMMGADPGKVHNGLTEEPERKKIIIILQKKAYERKDLTDKILLAGMQLESLEKKAYHTVKQAVLGGARMRDIYDAAVGVGLHKTAEKYVIEFEKRLIDETHGDVRNRLEKLAIHKAPEDLISNNLGNVTVINGAHPVLISLDTVQRKTGEIKNGLHNLLRIDDEVKVFQQRMRDLS